MKHLLQMIAVIATNLECCTRSNGQRRQSGLKSGGSWIRGKKSDFLGKLPKFFFRQFDKQKIDFSGQITEEFRYFTGNFK